MVGWKLILPALVVTLALAGGATADGPWYFQTEWGDYELSSPTEGPRRVTNDNSPIICNTTAFPLGHKVTTLLPPDGTGAYTAAFVYGKATDLNPKGLPHHELAAAKYCEKGKDDLDWSYHQDIGEVFCEPGRGMNGYLASDVFGNIYLAYTDMDDLTPEAVYVVKKAGPGEWAAGSAPELVLGARQIGTISPDMSGYCLSSAYGTEDQLGISTVHCWRPTARHISTWANAKSASGSWFDPPILTHGLEFQARDKYGTPCTMDEEGRLYTCYRLYIPDYPVAWFLPRGITQPGSCGVTVIPEDRQACGAYVKSTYLGHYLATNCAPYMDYANPGGPYWHISWTAPGSLIHLWQDINSLDDGAWTGELSLRAGLPANQSYGNPNIATYYDEYHGYFYIVYVYKIGDNRAGQIPPYGWVYLDVVRFDPITGTDTLVFASGFPNDRGLEMLHEKSTCFYPQVTVDKGIDGSFDIIVAWTESNDVMRNSDGPYCPVDGDVFYRQFTLTYLDSD